MYGPDSSYTKADLDERKSAYERQKREKEKEKIAQRTAEIVIENMKASNGKI